MESIDITVLRKVRDWRAAGHPTLLATVIKTWGSSPRPVGAMMGLRDDGRTVGSISGGCIEDDLIRRYTHAQSVLSMPSSSTELVRYGVSADEAYRFGLPCGGTLELLLEFNPEHAPLEVLVQRLESGLMMQRTVFCANGRVVLNPAESIEPLSFDGDKLISTLGPQYRMLLIGAGLLAEYLSTMAVFNGFAVTICDPRTEYLDEWSVDGVNKVSEMPDDAVVSFRPDQCSCIVALTHDPKLDDLALLEALHSNAFYVGAIGSRRNSASRRDRMINHFGETAASLERLHSPVGIHIGSKTPAEIAVSIMADIIAFKNGINSSSKMAYAEGHTRRIDENEIQAACPLGTTGSVISGTPSTVKLGDIFVNESDSKDGVDPMNIEQKLAAALEDEIGKRKQLEVALEAREREFSDFVEYAAVGLHQVGPDGAILWANQAELNMLGYSAEEYIGRSIVEFHADAYTIDDILRRLTSGETIRDYPARLKCKDGKIKHVFIHSNGRFENGKLRYTRCFTRDVTDKVIREQVLSERNNLLLQAPVATALLIGPNFTFELANDMYKHIVGKDDLENKDYFEVFPELKDSDLLGILTHVYETGQPFSTNEHRLALIKNGKKSDFFFKFNLQPLKRASGEIFGMMAVAVDITELVNSRERLRQNQVERDALLRKLEASDRAKDEFLAVLGHELRNPLSPIVTALDLMRMRGDVGITKEYGILQRQVKHLLRLVDDLLDVSRITRGKVDLRKSNVVVQDVIKKALETVSVLAEQRYHSLHIDDHEAGLEWYGDPIRLSQILTNLLTNAIHYTPQGGHITLKCWKEEDHVCVSVADNGIGISTPALSKIFDLFYQVPGKSERAKGGLGIGLSLVNSLVSAHGGTVQAVSKGHGKGSEFIVRLPLIRFASPEQFESNNREISAISQRVLIVDDNKDAADTLNELLSMNGHSTMVAYDPITALSLAKSYQPEVVITDIGMPIMNGYELAIHLRSGLDNPSSCRMYAISGFGQRIDKEQSRQAGFLAHFVRPVDAETILKALCT